MVVLAVIVLLLGCYLVYALVHPEVILDPAGGDHHVTDYIDNINLSDFW